MNNLKNYIIQSFAKGSKKPQIEAALRKAGWTKDLIDSAFYSVEFEKKQFLQSTQRKTISSKKIIVIFALTIIILGFFYQFFIHADFENGCFVKIIPSPVEWNNLNIKRAIKILKYGSPPDYKDFCAHIDTIDGNTGCGGFEGGCFQPNSPKTITVSTAQEEKIGAWSVGVIVHETCHAMQYAEGKPLSETECHTADSRLLKSIIQF